MEELLSKCGMNCAACPSYRENLITDTDRQRCSDGWATYHGFRITPAKLRCCDGCQAPDEGKPIRYLNCYVRQCAVKNGVLTCAHCSGYPCEDVPTVSVSTEMREQIAGRLGNPVPESDYLMFIEPYEGMKRLDALRATLAAGDIVLMQTVSSQPRIAAFPEDLTEMAGMRSLHGILATIEARDGVSYARQHQLKKRRTYLLKLLWAFGLHGEFDPPAAAHLSLEAASYLGEGLHSGYRVLLDGLERLREYGVECEHVPSRPDGWLTPTGALRKRDWRLTMTIRDSAGGRPALDALQTLVRTLDERYGKSAFRYFSAADMRAWVE